MEHSALKGVVEKSICSHEQDLVGIKQSIDNHIKALPTATGEDVNARMEAIADCMMIQDGILKDIAAMKMLLRNQYA